MFIAQNPQTSIGRNVKGLFIEGIGRNSFRKNLATIVISGIGESQCKLSLKLSQQRQGKENKMLERKSVVHKIVEFWITMTPRTSRKTNEALILYTNRMSVCDLWFKSYLPHSGWQSAAFLSSFEWRIFELFGVDFSADHQITRIESHTSKNRAPVMLICSNLAVETWNCSDLHDMGVLPS